MKTRQKLHKLTAILLMIILFGSGLFPALPAHAAADEGMSGRPGTAASDEAASETLRTDADDTIVTVNPFYMDVLTEEDILEKVATGEAEAATVSAEENTLPAPETFRASPCRTIEEAGAVLCAGYKNRVGKYVEVPVLVVSGLNDYFMDIAYAAFNHTGAPDEGDYLYILWQGGSVSRHNNDDGTVLMTFKETFLTTAAEEAMVDLKTRSVLKTLVSSTTDNRVKIRKVYDYICANVTYDYEHLGNPEYGYQYTAYAALFDGTAVCAGYAILFYRMMLECGIDCRMITGKGKNEDGYHAWNIVKISKWYFLMDTTWDAGRERYLYYLKGRNYFPDHTAEAKYLTEEFTTQYPIFYGLGQTNFRNLENSPEGIKVSWWEADNAAWYSVQRQLVPYQEWEEVGYTKKTEFLDTGAEIGKKYNYRIAPAVTGFTDEACDPVSIIHLPFTDIPYYASYAEAVAWAVNRDIIKGTSASTFSPLDECCRYQFAVMLYKYYHKPAVGNVTLPFKDVKKSASYYNAVAWAYSKGIIKGTSKTTFSPNAPITRYQAVQMLYKMIGKPAFGNVDNPFIDVSKTDSYYNAVLWAVKDGITVGTDAVHFSPMKTCSRYQMAVFLYKFHTGGNG